MILKGSFVCAYVGERISEEDLQIHEENKLTLLKSESVSDASSSSIEELLVDENSETSSDLKGYITYTFQIHDGTDVVNIDSE